MLIYLLLFLLLLMPAQVFAATQVVDVDPAQGRVSVTKTGETEGIQAGEAVCLTRGAQRLGCGRAQTATHDRVWIGIGDKAPLFARGNVVTISRPERGISSVSEPTTVGTVRNKGEQKTFDAGLGGHISYAYFFPELYFNARVGDQATLGVEVIFSKFSSDASSSTLAGAFFNCTYYEKAVFNGLGFQVGPGLYSLGLTERGLAETLHMPAIKGQVFWRGTAKAAFNLDFGLALGAQYIFGKDSPIISYRFRDLLPYVNFFVGYQF